MSTPQGGSSTPSKNLITSNIALVGHLVRETMGRVPSYVDRGDLTSAGLVALVHAARAFDESRGIPFARYASIRIRGAILDELRGLDWASRSVRHRGRSIDDARSQLANSLGRPPTNDEVATLLGIDLATVSKNDGDLARATVLSLQGGSETVLEDLMISHEPDPAAEFEHRERLSYLVASIAELPERLRIVVNDYFMAERPMADIAVELGVSESRVSQLRAEALVLLRGALNRHLDPALETPHQRPGGAADRRREAYFAAVAQRHEATSPRRRGAKQVNSTA